MILKFQQLRFPRISLKRNNSATDQRGVTIIELMIAILVFGFVASGVAVAMGTSLNTIRNNKNRSVAANLAAAKMEELRVKASKNFSSLVPGQTVTTQSVDGINYSITEDSEWVPQNSSTSACQSPTGSIPAYLRVSLSVTWPNMAGARAVRSQTIMSPPVGAYDPNSGHIAVKVIDAAGQPVPNMPVTVTATGVNRSQTTTADGCAFFAYLNGGTYTASINQTGWVDRQGIQNTSKPVGVTVGATTAIQFDYDREATVNLTLGQDESYNFPPGTLPVTFANTGLTPSGTKKFTGSGATRTITDLFPYPSGYEVWVGDCADADPLLYGGTRLLVDTTPGSTVDATVPMKLVEVTVLNGSPPLEVGGKPVRVTHTNSTGCSSGYNWNPAGSTASSDPKTLKLRVPFGTWTFRITFPTRTTTALLDPTTPDPMGVVVGP